MSNIKDPMEIVPIIAAVLTAMAARTVSAAVTIRSVAIENASFEDGIPPDDL